MITSWNWSKRSYWDNPPNKLFRPIEIKEMLIAPIIKIPVNSTTGTNFIKTIQGPKNKITGELEIPSEKTSSIVEKVIPHALDTLGRMMINAGGRLLIPEGTEVAVPLTWADEVAGVFLIVGGIILVVIF